MNKKPDELKAIMDDIVERTDKYYFSITEVGTLFGLSRNTAREVCKKIPPATLSGSKKYYIYDILKAVYR